MSGSATQITTRDRLISVDVIRGVAILGILMINMLAYSGPYMQMMDPPWWTALDHYALLFIQVLGMGKFITLLSFMFGFGMVMIKQGAERRGVRFVPLYLRRLLALLVFGSLHAFLLWEGDILMVYAIVGFILLLFHDFRPKTLAIWGFVCMGIVMFFIGLVFISAILLQAFDADLDSGLGYNQVLYDALVATYGSGTFSEIFAQRFEDWQGSFFGTIPLWFENLGMFLFGAYTAKKRILHDLPEHLPFVKRVWLVSLIAGVLITAITMGLHYLSAPTFTIHLNAEDIFGVYLAAPFLCFFYATSLVLLLQRASWQKRLAPLASVGRMAFSVYIMQSLICTTLFYSYGFGLYGELGAFWGLMMTFAIWAVQIVFCVWWMKRFRFGPLEWIWRIATYLRVPAIKRETSAGE